MSTPYMHAVYKIPLYIFPIWVFLLNGAAQSPRPLLRFTPGYAAVRRRNDLATLGLPRGTPHAGFPRTPSPRPPTKGSSPRTDALATARAISS